MFGREQRLIGELFGDARYDPLEAGAVSRVIVGRDCSIRLVLTEETRVANLAARLTHDRPDEFQRDVDGGIARHEARSFRPRKPVLQPAKQLRPDARLAVALPREQPSEVVRKLRRDADVRILQHPQRRVGEAGGIRPGIARHSWFGVPLDLGTPDGRRNQTKVDHLIAASRSACQSAIAA